MPRGAASPAAWSATERFASETPRARRRKSGTEEGEDVMPVTLEAIPVS
jgi:hypothetical protein